MYILIFDFSGCKVTNFYMQHKINSFIFYRNTAYMSFFCNFVGEKKKF